MFTARRSIITALAATMPLAAAAVVPAGAETAQVAPGAPTRLLADYSIDGLPEATFDGLCTQGPNGTLRLPDGSERNVMITAAHCTVTVYDHKPFKPGVYLPTQSGNILLGKNHSTSGFKEYRGYDVGEFVRLNLNAGDWSVVELEPGFIQSRVSHSRTSNGESNGEPVVMTGVKDYRRLAPHEVSFDNFGQPICKDGAVSGRSCGTQILRTNNGVWSYGMSYVFGDSGGNNFDPRTGEVIGVTSMSFLQFDRAQPVDYALETAYGIPDGEVNSHFTLAESTAPHDPSLRTKDQDAALYRDDYQQIDPIELAAPEDQVIMRQKAATDRAFAEAQRDVTNAVSTAIATGNPVPAVKQVEQSSRAVSMESSALIKDIVYYLNEN